MQFTSHFLRDSPKNVTLCVFLSDSSEYLPLLRYQRPPVANDSLELESSYHSIVSYHKVTTAFRHKTGVQQSPFKI